MPKLFISYRREDSAGFAGRLTDALEQRIGAGSVFRDVDDIRPGEDFEAVIERGLRHVQVVLVVIGPGWLEAAADGQRRLDRPDDFVRREVEGALASGKPVVPILVGGASMPGAAALPSALRGLANRQALVMGDASWAADLARLQAVLAQWLEAPAAPPASRRTLLVGMATVALAALGLGAWWVWQGRGPGPEAVVGAWKAEVAYPWNLSLEERFDFALRDGRIEGQASFLGVARALEAAEWRDGRLHFLTRSETVSGNESAREMVQRYELTPAGDTLRVRLQIHRSHSVDAPLEFLAQRR
jgi:hypothetical protein